MYTKDEVVQISLEWFKMDVPVLFACLQNRKMPSDVNEIRKLRDDLAEALAGDFASFVDRVALNQATDAMSSIAEVIFAHDCASRGMCSASHALAKVYQGWVLVGLRSEKPELQKAVLGHVYDSFTAYVKVNSLDQTYRAALSGGISTILENFFEKAGVRPTVN